MGSCASLQSPSEDGGRRPSTPAAKPQTPVEGQQPFREAAKKNPRRNRHHEHTFVLTDDVLQQLRERPMTPQSQSATSHSCDAAAHSAVPIIINPDDDHDHHHHVMDCSFSGGNVSFSESFAKTSESGCAFPLPQTSEEIGGYRAQIAHKVPLGERILYFD